MSTGEPSSRRRWRFGILKFTAKMEYLSSTPTIPPILALPFPAICSTRFSHASLTKTVIRDKDTAKDHSAEFEAMA